MKLPAFDDPQLFDWLLQADREALDRLVFGVIGLDAALVCTHYNLWEQRQAGLSPERVLGRAFFDQVAPCMNNYLVADPLSQPDTRDERLAYTLSVKVTPTPVELRLLVRADESQRFLVIDWPAGA